MGSQYVVNPTCAYVVKPMCVMGSWVWQFYRYIHADTNEDFCAPGGILLASQVNPIMEAGNPFRWLMECNPYRFITPVIEFANARTLSEKVLVSILGGICLNKYGHHLKPVQVAVRSKFKRLIKYSSLGVAKIVFGLFSWGIDLVYNLFMYLFVSNDVAVDVTVGTHPVPPTHNGLFTFMGREWARVPGGAVKKARVIGGVVGGDMQYEIINEPEPEGQYQGPGDSKLNCVMPISDKLARGEVIILTEDGHHLAGGFVVRDAPTGINTLITTRHGTYAMNKMVVKGPLDRTIMVDVKNGFTFEDIKTDVKDVLPWCDVQDVCTFRDIIVFPLDNNALSTIGVSALTHNHLSREYEGETGVLRFCDDDMCNIKRYTGIIPEAKDFVHKMGIAFSGISSIKGSSGCAIKTIDQTEKVVGMQLGTPAHKFKFLHGKYNVIMHMDTILCLLIGLGLWTDTISEKLNHLITSWLEEPDTCPGEMNRRKKKYKEKKRRERLQLDNLHLQMKADYEEHLNDQAYEDWACELGITGAGYGASKPQFMGPKPKGESILFNVSVREKPICQYRKGVERKKKEEYEALLARKCEEDQNPAESKQPAPTETIKVEPTEPKSPRAASKPAVVAPGSPRLVVTPWMQESMTKVPVVSESAPVVDTTIPVQTITSQPAQDPVSAPEPASPTTPTMLARLAQIAKANPACYGGGRGRGKLSQFGAGSPDSEKPPCIDLSSTPERLPVSEIVPAYVTYDPEDELNPPEPLTPRTKRKQRLTALALHDFDEYDEAAPGRGQMRTYTNKLNRKFHHGADRPIPNPIYTPGSAQYVGRASVVERSWPQSMPIPPPPPPPPDPICPHQDNLLDAPGESNAIDALHIVDQHTTASDDQRVTKWKSDILAGHAEEVFKEIRHLYRVRHYSADYGSTSMRMWKNFSNEGPDLYYGPPTRLSRAEVRRELHNYISLPCNNTTRNYLRATCPEWGNDIDTGEIMNCPNEPKDEPREFPDRNGIEYFVEIGLMNGYRDFTRKHKVPEVDQRLVDDLKGMLRGYEKNGTHGCTKGPYEVPANTEANMLASMEAQARRADQRDPRGTMSPEDRGWLATSIAYAKTVYTQGLRDNGIKDVLPALNQGKAGFLSALHELEDKSSGVSNYYRRLSKQMWAENHADELVDLVVTRLILLCVADEHIIYMTPEELVHYGLADLKELHIKSEHHAKKKMDDKRFRLIWVNSLIDIVVQNLLHKADNNAMCEAYDNGKFHYGALTMGHDQAGIRKFAEAARNLDLIEHNVTSDISAYDLSVPGSLIRADGERRAYNVPEGLLYTKRFIKLFSYVLCKHVVSAGRSVFRCEKDGVTSSGQLSTTAQNTFVRTVVGFFCGSYAHVSIGDDTVADSGYDPARTSLLYMTSRDVEHHFMMTDFTSHKIDFTSLTASFNNVQKMLYHLVQCAEEGVGMVDRLGGCLYVVRNTVEVHRDLLQIAYTHDPSISTFIVDIDYGFVSL